MLKKYQQKKQIVTAQSMNTPYKGKQGNVKIIKKKGQVTPFRFNILILPPTKHIKTQLL